MTMMTSSSREVLAMQMIQITAAAERGPTGCGGGGCHQQRLAGLDLQQQGLALLLQLLQVMLVGLVVDRSGAVVHQQQQKQMMQAVSELHVVSWVALQETLGLHLQETASGVRHLLRGQAAVMRGARRRM
jgi:hypothetical protein